ncbi:hypothetical protein LXL04_035394 [Taraxacum kok-saghyz]
MQQPPPPASKLSPTAITTEQIQKCLEDNKNLIMAIMENQNLGKFQECAQYQAVLQKNLMYLAAIADTHPPPPTPTPTPTPPPPQLPNQSQATPSLPPGFMPQQANNFMQQPQPGIPQLPGGGGGGGGQKLPFQLNSLRTQDQQQQLLQFQQQQQIQAQMGLRPGGQGGGLFGMHQVMNHGGDLVNGQGSKQDGSDVQNQFQSPFQPPFQPQFQTQPTPTEDVVYETQRESMSQSSRQKKGRKGKTTTAQDKVVPWTPEELVCLADAWCLTSKDSIKGNDHKKDGYWEEIRKLFHKLMRKADYRNTGALSSKLSQIRPKLTKFNGIHNRIQNGLEDQEREIVQAAKNKSRSWISKFLSKK